MNSDTSSVKPRFLTPLTRIGEPPASDPSSLLSISPLDTRPRATLWPPRSFHRTSRGPQRSTSVKIERGACRTYTLRSHARSNRAKEPSTANHQRGKHHEIDSVVATTFQTTLPAGAPPVPPLRGSLCVGSSLSLSRPGPVIELPDRERIVRVFQSRVARLHSVSPWRGSSRLTWRRSQHESVREGEARVRIQCFSGCDHCDTGRARKTQVTQWSTRGTRDSAKSSRNWKYDQVERDCLATARRRRLPDGDGTLDSVRKRGIAAKQCQDQRQHSRGKWSFSLLWRRGRIWRATQQVLARCTMCAQGGHVEETKRNKDASNYVILAVYHTWVMRVRFLLTFDSSASVVFRKKRTLISESLLIWLIMPGYLSAMSWNLQKAALEFVLICCECELFFAFSRQATSSCCLTRICLGEASTCYMTW